jgi:hypothetical protein
MSEDGNIRSRQLPYGFIFGTATVARLYADRRGVGLEVTTSRDFPHPKRSGKSNGFRDVSSKPSDYDVDSHKT